ncbi:group III truncated hemoglobin [Aureispira anguillae]|uniref:Group III truncated hemoglobin n=1 Tax=Aureispira anguillae TaxID=2864201 RepID=A0A915YIA8_9BACT|nr:group III truncated hemoglobin [Aureispira anguillae]BDS13598.1 group III truncated hemoglobin [Aureispira anguillae]
MKNNNKDITSEKDVVLMVDSFYEKVNKNPLLSYVFNDFSQVDWEAHLPKMYRFWNTLILGKRTYKGNPFAAHISLPIKSQHFEQWVKIFEQNIDEHFVGPVAEDTKKRANSIAYIFQAKLAHLKQ